MIDLFFIKTFLAVVKTGSFRLAAQQNHISQPAVSQQIAILERKMGAILLERKPRKIYLTDAGKAFLPYADQMIKQYEEAKMMVGETVNKYQGTIRIAAIYSIGLYGLQPIIKKFLQKYPNIHIHLECRPNHFIYQLIANRSFDFGLVAYPQKKNDIATEVFSEDHLCLIQSSKHPVIKKNMVSFNDLNQTPFIAFSDSTPTGIKIKEFFQSIDIKPKIIDAYDNIETLKRAVEVGMGFAFIPKSTIAQELKNHALKIIRLQEPLNLTRPLGIIYAKDKVFTKSLRSFYNMILTKIQNDRLR